MKKFLISGVVSSVQLFGEKVTVLQLETGKVKFPVTVFGNYGRALAEKVVDGLRATISGELVQNHFTNAEGKEVSQVQLVADEVMLGTQGEVNSVQLWGRVATEPATTVTKNGNRITHFAVVDNTVRRTGDGSYEKEAHFFNVDGWNEVSDQMAQIHKGQKVAITGTLRKNVWQPAEGEVRSEIRVNATSLEVPSLTPVAAAEPVAVGASSAPKPTTVEALLEEFPDEELPF